MPRTALRPARSHDPPTAHVPGPLTLHGAATRTVRARMQQRPVPSPVCAAIRASSPWCRKGR
eukprot:scaffold2628_cov67-Phaeocystis_antarctica.AAC.4